MDVVNLPKSNIFHHLIGNSRSASNSIDIYILHLDSGLKINLTVCLDQENNIFYIIV